MTNNAGPQFKTHRERLNHHTDTSDPDGCWRWGGARDKDGYGKALRGLAHRHAYEDAYGPIPEDLQIDHLCRVRDCVNPKHLEAVTFAENMRRSQPYRTRFMNGKGVRTHCNSGHEYTPENTYVYRGGRLCRACNRRNAAASKQRRTARAEKRVA